MGLEIENTLPPLLQQKKQELFFQKNGGD